MMTRINRIKKILEKLQPTHVEVIDESHLHMDHFDPKGVAETHLRVRILSDILRNESLLQRHRMINSLLSGEFNKGLHSLEIEIIDDRYESK